MNYKELEAKVGKWGLDRGIVQTGNIMTQAVKTLEETAELLEAVNCKDEHETKDAIGDIVVTLIMICEVMGTDLVTCLGQAYDEIKDRTGKLSADGRFIKDRSQ